ncbi:MAG: aminopeptidase [Bacilli bacterium]|nr:aminopeptidase [Bacilli bacterium]MDY4052744.1 aminopeptidase [Bacilli bacterium]
MNKENLLKEFAKLAIRVGINIQPKQYLIVNAPVEAYEFVRIVVEEAYNAGAGNVIINWKDDTVNSLYYQNVSDEVLTEVPQFLIDKYRYVLDKGAALLSITSPNPNVYKNVDPMKMAMASNASNSKLKFFSDYTMASRTQWAIIAYPNYEWAQQVFPTLPKEEAYEKLLEAILYTSRVEEKKDSVQEWNNHMKNLEVHNQILNDYNFEKIHFKNGIGTDLEIYLVENHIWAGGGEMSEKGVFFAPNIPTEETFTMPHNKKINGTVVSTKPLNFRGKLIPKFKLTFKDGVVVKYEADEEIETLKSLLETDEGSKSLGEVALISYDSPISNLGIIFYNTLFDENASCHLALGNAYSMNIKDGTTMPEEELVKLGYNVSNVHVDFMFGSSDMEIVGTTHDGKEIQIFRKGNFVI